MVSPMGSKHQISRLLFGRSKFPDDYYQTDDGRGLMLHTTSTVILFNPYNYFLLFFFWHATTFCSLLSIIPINKQVFNFANVMWLKLFVLLYFQFKHDTLWFPPQLDFRGRAYPKSKIFSYQGIYEECLLYHIKLENIQW